MIPFKINQPVKTPVGRIGRILFYTDYKISQGDHEVEPTSAIILFINRCASKYPFCALTSISRDEYNEAVKADKAVQAILQNLAVSECAI